MSKMYDYIIIGAGIMGLSIARSLKSNDPLTRILIIEKESDCATHASGRNSGVLHAGFYYTAESLKAKFTVDGNRQMKAYCHFKGIPVNACGKLVVAQNESELSQLYELERRGHRNGSNIKIISEQEALTIEPNVKTFQKALYSPDTASIDPKHVCQSIAEDLKNLNVDFSFETKYLRQKNHTLFTNKGEFPPPGKKIINCSGLYADTIAQDFGFGQDFTMMPFKGLYLKYTKNKTDINVNIYPVPNLKNPFLGVHFTKTVNGDIKIGPTAIPAFWRENYQGISHFRFSELTSTAFYQSLLFMKNSFQFRELALEEIRKYNKDYFISLATAMVRSIDPSGFTQWTKPGIRAQLLHKSTLSLVQDFVIEADHQSVHILNAVSPAFTCAFAFADHIVEKYLKS